MDAERSAIGGLDDVLVLDSYWADSEKDRSGERPARTGVGQLVHRAKDLGDREAAAELGRRLASLAHRVGRSGDGLESLVTGVPSDPAPALGLPTVLAAALATAGAGEHRPGLIVRRHRTEAVRYVDPDRRAEVVAAAGYEVSGEVAGRTVVLVDDVIFTGTTVGTLAGLLRAAGASGVTAVVAAMTRRR